MTIWVPCLVTLNLAGPVCGQVFSYECNSLSEEAGWEVQVLYCDPELRVDGGWFVQHVKPGCGGPPNGGQHDLGRTLDEYAGVESFFVEWRVHTDGDRSEIDGTAPANLAVGNVFGVVYHCTIARDLVRFSFFRRPTVFFPIEPDYPHTYRLELYGDTRYILFVDGFVEDIGVPEGAFPTNRSQIDWRAKSWYLESTTKWDYIRYGRIPEDASGDYDSDDDFDLFDYYFVHECFSLSGPGVNAGPGCRFADFDGDADTDLRDFAQFQNRFTGGG